MLGQTLDFLHSVSDRDTTSSQNDWILCLGNQSCSFVQTLLASRSVLERSRGGYRERVLSVEVISRNVDLNRTTLMHRNIERSCGEFGNTRWIVHVSLILGDCLKDGHLIELLKSSESFRRRSCFRRDHDDRTVSPIRRSDTRQKVRHTRSVLSDTYSVFSRSSRVSVGHVSRVLLVSDRHESDSCFIEEIKRIHKRTTNDTRTYGDTMSDHGLHKCFRIGHAKRYVV